VAQLGHHHADHVRPVACNSRFVALPDILLLVLDFSGYRV
jgi:hypothetical protein